MAKRTKAVKQLLKLKPMVTRFDKCGWDLGTADESSRTELILNGGSGRASSTLGQTQKQFNMGENRSALAHQAALSTLPVYETHLGFMYIGESFDEDKTVPRNEDQAGFSFKSHDSEEDGIFARQLAAKAAAPSGSELVLNGFSRNGSHAMQPSITFSRFSQFKDSAGLGGVS